MYQIIKFFLNTYLFFSLWYLYMTTYIPDREARQRLLYPCIGNVSDRQCICLWDFSPTYTSGFSLTSYGIFPKFGSCFIVSSVSNTGTRSRILYSFRNWLVFIFKSRMHDRRSGYIFLVGLNCIMVFLYGTIKKPIPKYVI